MDRRQTVTGKNLAIGILAHVDAGKTTLSESILYKTGVIRKAGRVDHGDAFLDGNAIEKARGITVFSKEARFTLGDLNFTLLDTPGHSDFSTEMERTLAVMDYAVLLISGADGVQSHTLTLWKLLKSYNIPTFIFVNKMDQSGTDRQSILSELSEVLGGGFVEMMGAAPADEEEAATCSEELMETYLETGELDCELMKKAVALRQMFPVCFGSALKMEGVDELLECIGKNAEPKAYPEEFGARVYKITYDKHGQRQTHLKVTGGVLKNKMVITGLDVSGEGWEAKAEQIRVYSGGAFKAVSEVEAGGVCAVTGLARSRAGQGVGSEAGEVVRPVLEPALTCRIILPDGMDPVIALGKLRQLEEEDPMLRIKWKEELQEIHVQVMGQLELEVLQHQIKERFDMNVSFGEGSIIYKETISAPVIGIGHFEPLRHYAEVHLLLEPATPGSGLTFDSKCSEDLLDRNWQRLIHTHLVERQHPGVLTGSEITDMKISILAGRAHQKHTEGGDFRQATYRAIRQGLRKAEAAGKAVLLEPVYSYRLEIPVENLGRAMTDMERLGATCSMPENSGAYALLTGQGPVATLQDYQREVTAYSKGMGRFTASLAGYAPCHNQEEVLQRMGYVAESDVMNPTGSVFCDHGAAVYVDWQQVDDMAHVESGYVISDGDDGDSGRSSSPVHLKGGYLGEAAEKELEEIFLRTYGKSKRDEALRREQLSQKTRKAPPVDSFPQIKWKSTVSAKDYLIVDGYNVIFAWDELKALVSTSLDAARDAFLEIMMNYQGYKKTGICVVFDGYRRPGNPGTKMKVGDVEVVFTKEGESADRFIEETAYELGRTYDITVVTSDRQVQMAAFGDGAKRLSSRDFYAEVAGTSEEIRAKLARQEFSKNRPFEEAFKSR